MPEVLVFFRKEQVNPNGDAKIKKLLSRQLRTSLPCNLEIRHLWQIAFSTVFVYTRFNSGKIGAVYMILGRLSLRREFAPFAFLGSVFVDVMPSKNCHAGATHTSARVHSSCCTGVKISVKK